MESSNENREDVLHVPNLFDFFCTRTSEDMRVRVGSGNEAPATSFASLIITLLMAFAFYVFGKPALAKATFVLFGVLVAWTIWGVVIRSSEQVSQKADNVKAGVFPPQSAPFVLARLKWWNHLIVPMRWGKHSRLFDRKGKLERKVAELQGRIDALIQAGNAAYQPPSDEEIIMLADSIHTFSDRHNYELQVPNLPDELSRLRADLVLYRALLHKLDEMAERLDRIEKLQVVFHNVSPEDLSQVVSESIQLLEERRILVLSVDNTDPEEFIDLVSIRTA
ncbi:MAG: hypothetical protein LUC93_08750 [Planctomycetaceae bacterium]|nr:hypothetical protein [Planctomycetaceae bacterium]